MKNFLTSWKTTICGVVLLGFSVALFIINRPVEGALAAASGIGLIAAKDGNVTGGTKDSGQTPD